MFEVPMDIENEWEKNQAKIVIVNQNDSDADKVPDYAD
jgi:hypothetical protein